jgi:hypothetical protein
LQRLYSELLTSLRRHEYDWNKWKISFHSSDKLQAIKIWHVQVRNDDVRPMSFKLSQGVFAIGGIHHGQISIRFQQCTDELSIHL